MQSEVRTDHAGIPLWCSQDRPIGNSWQGEGLATPSQLPLGQAGGQRCRRRDEVDRAPALKRDATKDRPSFPFPGTTIQIQKTVQTILKDEQRHK